MAAYLEKIFGFSSLLGTCLQDRRVHPQIALVDVFRCVLLLFGCRLSSLNGLEEVLRRRGSPLVEGRYPSADTVGRVFARMEPDGVRSLLKSVTGIARRSKILRHRGTPTPWTCAVDGHEHFKSFQRSCPECLQRKVVCAHETRTQYYHSSVVAHLIEAEPPMPLDAEMLQPGEGEVVAARRLVNRVIAAYPFIEVFTMDALFLEAPILKAIVQTGRGAIVPLKQEARELYQEAQRLFNAQAPMQAELNGEQIEYWDIPSLRAWDAMGETPIRVVRTLRHRKVRRRVGRAWTEFEETQDWTWAVVGVHPSTSPLMIHRLGHGRWDIENCGFNEHDRLFGLDHCFKHEPTAILNFILTLFLGSMLTEIFFTRNLKDPEYRRMTLLGLARLLLENPPKPSDPTIWASARSP